MFILAVNDNFALTSLLVLFIWYVQDVFCLTNPCLESFDTDIYLKNNKSQHITQDITSGFSLKYKKQPASFLKIIGMVTNVLCTQ